MATPADIPPFTDLMWPTLAVIKDLGGSARIEEISEGVIEREGFSEELQEVLRKPDDHMSMIDYRLAWARNYLKNIGALENSARGVWAVTDLGRLIRPEEIPDRVREYKREYYRQRKLRQQEPVSEDVDESDEVEVGQDWKEVLVDRLLDMEPDAFERLAQRLPERGRVPQRRGPRSGRRRRDRRRRRLPIVIGELPGVFPMQAIQRVGAIVCGSGFPRRDVRQR
jgi:restriction system protein